MAKRAYQQEREATGHTAPPVKNQKQVNADVLLTSVLFHLGPSPEMVLFTFPAGLPTSGKPL